MEKIKNFCEGSIVLVIYHADVGVKQEDNQKTNDDACVQSSNFFDANIHVQNGALMLRTVCSA